MPSGTPLGAVLDRLRTAGPLSLSEIAEPLPMTRQAVTKHLNILERAGLVERRREGRERIHVAKGDSLKAVADWLAPWDAAWDDRLGRLKRFVEGDDG